MKRSQKQNSSFYYRKIKKESLKSQRNWKISLCHSKTKILVCLILILILLIGLISLGVILIAKPNAIIRHNMPLQNIVLKNKSDIDHKFLGGVPNLEINRAEQMNREQKEQQKEKQAHKPIIEPKKQKELIRDNLDGGVPIIKRQQPKNLLKNKFEEDKHNLSKNLMPVVHKRIDLHEVYRTIVQDNIPSSPQKQGQVIEYDEKASLLPENKLKVFVVPHSHCDPGQINTYENYYYGQVRNILNSVVKGLLKDSRRKFIWAEISFFILQQEEQTNSTKESVRKLVCKTKQLEFVTGGWVMNDEANPDIYAMIEQMTQGLDQLYETFGIRPKNSQSIDPFGYSSSMIQLLKQFGFRTATINRVHYRIKKYLAQTKDLEFFWRQAQINGFNSSVINEYDMFTHLLPFYSYDVAHTCGPDPAVCCEFDFARVEYGKYKCPSVQKSDTSFIDESNLKNKAEKLVDQYRKMAELYPKHNVLLVPLGDDFRYDNDEEVEQQYTNYQKIFDYANRELNVNMKFGTLEDYFQAIDNFNVDTVKKEDENKNLENDEVELYKSSIYSEMSLLDGSFFTYSDKDTDYQSGYYTSRKFYKNLGRLLEQNLFSAEIALMLAFDKGQNFVNETDWSILTDARRQLSLFQHHDGVTGTSKVFVMVDYGKRMHEAIKQIKNLTSRILSKILLSSDKSFGNNDIPRTKITLQNQLKQEQFNSLQEQEIFSKTFVLTIFNPRNKPSIETVRQLTSFYHACVIHISLDDSSKNDENFLLSKKFLDFQYNILNPDDTQSNKNNSDVYEITFQTLELKAFSTQTYLILKLDDYKTKYDNGVLSKEVKKAYEYLRQTFEERGKAAVWTQYVVDDDQKLQDENDDIDTAPTITLKYDSTPAYIFDSSTGFLQHVNFKADNLFKLKEEILGYKDQGGAYLFQPDDNSSAQKLSELIGNNIKNVGRSCFQHLNGPIKSEIRLQIPFIERRAILYKDAMGLKFEYLLNLADYKGDISLIGRFTTSLDNGNVLYSDLNNLQMEKHQIRTEKVIQANYFPMTAMASLEDIQNQDRFTICTNHPTGVGSTGKGQIEIMLDRKVSHDESRGLGHGIFDNTLTYLEMNLLYEIYDGEEHIVKQENEKTMNTQHINNQFKPSIQSHILSEKLNNPLQLYFDESFDIDNNILMNYVFGKELYQEKYTALNNYFDTLLNSVECRKICISKNEYKYKSSINSFCDFRLVKLDIKSPFNLKTLINEEGKNSGKNNQIWIQKLLYSSDYIIGEMESNKKSFDVLHTQQICTDKNILLPRINFFNEINFNSMNEGSLIKYEMAYS